MSCCYTNVPLPAPILTDNLTDSTDRRLCAVRYVTKMVRNPIIPISSSSCTAMPADDLALRDPGYLWP